MVRIVIYLQLLKSHRNRRNSLVLDEGNTLFSIFGKILLIIIVFLLFSFGYFSFSFFTLTRLVVQRVG